MRSSSLALVMAVTLAAPALHGATTCVNSVASFQSALTAAQANGQDDVIQVVQGTYLLGSTLAYASGEAFGLSIQGGYAAGCGSRVLVPTNTVLDGQGAVEVLSVSSSAGAVLVEGLTIQNGNGPTPGLYAYTQGNAALTVRFDAFLANAGTNGNAGGLTAGVVNGTLTVANNLFNGNTAANGGTGGAIAISSGGNILVVNNTFTGNTGTGTNPYGGLRLYGSSGTPAAYASNNILWGNTPFDLDVVVLGSATIDHSDVGTWTGTFVPTFTSCINADPMFASASDFHLQNGSPAVNAGTATPAGGASLPTQDLDANARVVGPAPDMGAYESVVTPVELLGFDAR